MRKGRWTRCGDAAINTCKQTADLILWDRLQESGQDFKHNLVNVLVNAHVQTVAVKEVSDVLAVLGFLCGDGGPTKALTIHSRAYSGNEPPLQATSPFPVKRDDRIANTLVYS